MAKKQIKLSEEQLRDMIAENVNKVLSELDWKTYHSAAQKTSPKNPNRASGFGKAAEKAFNRKYGYQDIEDFYGSDYYAGYKDKKYGLDDTSPMYPRTELHLKPSWSDKETVYSYRPSSSEEFPLGSFVKDYDFDVAYGNANPKYQFGVGDAGRGFMSRKAATHGMVTGPKHIDAGNKDLFDYENGNYEYVKGKGWQLKENKIAKIVAESVKKVLKEMGENNVAPYYVDADSEEFFDFDEAYKHAYDIAEKWRAESGQHMEDVIIMDNIEWKPIVVFSYEGIDNIEDGTFKPW